MAALTRYNPWGEMLSLRQAMDRLFEDSFVSPTGWLTVSNRQPWPLVDIYETNDDVVVSATLPGISPENVEITLTGQTLTLRGELKAEQEVSNEQYVLRERQYGSFNRQIQMPMRVDGDNAEASFEHGVLTLRIPKAAEVKPRHIQIKAGEETKQLA